MIRLDSILAKLFTNPKCGDIKRNSLNRTTSGFTKISRPMFYGIFVSISICFSAKDNKNQLIDFNSISLSNYRNIFTNYRYVIVSLKHLSLSFEDI